MQEKDLLGFQETLKFRKTKNRTKNLIVSQNQKRRKNDRRRKILHLDKSDLGMKANQKKDPHNVRGMEVRTPNHYENLLSLAVQVAPP